MAVELVDGHAGEPHIDGSDAGIFKAGVCGVEGGILATSNKCACTINSNTSITIAEGELVMPTSGRLVRVKNPETLTITTGSASQKRNDLVVARYSKDSTTEIESVSLVVLRGTPTTGTPSDPATQVGDLKLYRLSLNGLTLQTPVKLANDIVPITSLSSRIKIGDGTVSWLGFSLSMRGFVYPALKLVEVELYSAKGVHSQATGGDGLSPVVFTIPEPYRPKYDITNALKGVLWSAGLGSIHIQKTGAVCYGLTYVRAVNDAGADTGNVFYSYE